MTSAPPGVELLGEALTYARSVLATVAPDDLHRPTPCAGWCLADLLAHLEDALDAFTEAADGRVWLAPASPALLTGPGVAAADLRDKTSRLMEAWSSPAAVVRVGGVVMPAATVVAAAALEVAVHGNDVARSVRPPRADDLGELPTTLARGLVGVAGGLAPAEDRTGRFDPPLSAPPGSGDSARLLAHLGRLAVPYPD